MNNNVHAGRRRYFCGSCRLPLDRGMDGCICENTKGCINEKEIPKLPITKEENLCPTCNFPLKETASGWITCLKCKSDFPKSSEKEDLINTPSHYQGKGGLQVRDVIIAFGLDKDFDLANVIKYVLRCNRKGNKRQDLQKAIKYLTWSLDNCQVNSDTD